MVDDLVKLARNVYQKINRERAEVGDDAVTFGNTFASYLTLLALISNKGLLGDARVKQAKDIVAMADRRDTKSTLPEENTFDYTKSVYLLTDVLYTNLVEE